MKSSLLRATAVYLTVLGAGLAATTAWAQSLMDPAFENTVQIEASDGTVTNIYFDPDGTYTTSDNQSGTWTLENSTLCTQTGENEPNCSEIEEHSVGDSWSETDPEGNPVTITIVAGR